jgi:hypothetical protein
MLPRYRFPFRSAAAAFTSLVLASTGCAPPRGPINIDPLIPRWALRHGGDECEPTPHLHEHVPLADPSAISPPVPKFHPLPTKPVFSPAAEYSSMLPAEPPGMPVKEPLTARRNGR